jgi:hypothetical protein
MVLEVAAVWSYKMGFCSVFTKFPPAKATFFGLYGVGCIAGSVGGELGERDLAGQVTIKQAAVGKNRDDFKR